MTVVVSFVVPGGGRGFATGVERVTARENITPPGTTTNTVNEGEMVVIGNAETSMVAVAFGATPDADATVATRLTSAGLPVPAGAVSYPISPAIGDKVNVKTVT